MTIVYRYILFLVWISYVLICGILLYMRGFLLNREVLNFNSSCKPDISQSYCSIFNNPSKLVKGDQILECLEENVVSKQLNNKIDRSQYCLQTGTKLIIVLIDALRYDFLRFRNNFTESNLLPYENNLPVIHYILDKFPQNARLYKFIADPPTTTMQRLKGLTTGSLPTFIDIGSNFATSEINEDNLIDQLVKYDKKVIFMGDDTWDNLYPNRFHRKFAFPSFNTWDLDTVDRGIKKHLIPEIQKNDWDVIIAHFLGVDHCGHRYGPLHEEMKSKLQEMNEVISNVVSQMNNNTMLFVIGDHGMTDSGDHGGSSEDELTAAMFVYSPHRALISDPKMVNRVRQIDLVPTIARIMGTPIPFSNIGCVILDALQASSANTDFIKNWEVVLTSLWTNVKQVTLYIQEYSKINQQLPAEKLNDLIKQYQELRLKFENLNNEEQLKEFVGCTRHYMLVIREMCESVWVQFDAFSMSRGLVVVFLTLTFIFLLTEGVSPEKIRIILEGKFLYFAYGGAVLSGISVCILIYLQIDINTDITIYFVTCVSAIFVKAAMVVHYWGSVSNNWYSLSKTKSCLNIFCRVVFFLSAISLFSNSYVVEESSVISFLLLSVVWTSLFDLKSESSKKSIKGQILTWKELFYSSRSKLFILVLLLSLFIRFSWKYRRCREEQTCVYEKTLLSNTSQCLLTIVCLVVFITASRLYLRCLGNLVGFSPTVFMSRYAPTIIVISMSGYWILQSLPRQTQYKLIETWQLQILPRTAMCLIVIGAIILFIRPLSIYHITHENETIPQENIIPTLFKQLKDLLLSRLGSDVKGYPIIFGLATAYSATFINLSILLSLFTSLLLGEGTAFVSIAMYLSFTFVAAISAFVRQTRSTQTSQLFIVPWWSVVCWGLSAVHFFYTTGHQASFSTLDWNSAFILTTNGQLESHLIPGLLVILNTFCSYVVYAVMLPLLIIMPFTIHAIFPRNQETKHAELALFEKDELMYSAMFSLCVRFILFFGFRVFVCMLSSAIHARHLMVWAIFAPKLIFEVLGFIIILPCVLIGFILIKRISTRLDKLLESIQQ